MIRSFHAHWIMEPAVLQAVKKWVPKVYTAAWVFQRFKIVFITSVPAMKSMTSCFCSCKLEIWAVIKIRVKSKTHFFVNYLIIFHDNADLKDEPFGIVEINWSDSWVQLVWEYGRVWIAAWRWKLINFMCWMEMEVSGEVEGLKDKQWIMSVAYENTGASIKHKGTTLNVFLVCRLVFVHSITKRLMCRHKRGNRHRL